VPAPIRRTIRHAALLGFALASMAVAAEPSRHVAVQAHRGYSEIYPENTLLAVRSAFEAGADVVEVDLALTSDGRLVLMHDQTVDRTTDGQGPVSAFTLAQLRELDAGSWKSNAYAGERVPTLEEVLELANGAGTVNLEIKSRGRLWSRTQDLIERAVRVVNEAGAADRVFFSSFEVRSLLEVRQHDPDMRLLLIDWDPPSSFDNLDMAILQKFHGWMVTPEYANEERVAKAKAAGLYVHVSRSSEGAMRDWIDWGIDQLGADDPASLVAWLESEGVRAAEGRTE
jgi:glycerophosphoryl diester phosphodiesterase